MAQRGHASYGLGAGAGGSSSSALGRGGAGGESSALETIRQYTSKIEDYLDTYSEPIKP